MSARLTGIGLPVLQTVNLRPWPSRCQPAALFLARRVPPHNRGAWPVGIASLPSAGRRRISRGDVQRAAVAGHSNSPRRTRR